MWTYRSGYCCDQTLWVGKAVQMSYPHSSVVALVGILIYQYSSPSGCQLSVVGAKFKFNIETTRSKYIELRLNIKFNLSIKSQPEIWILSFHSSYNPTSNPLFKPNVSYNLPKKKSHESVMGFLVMDTKPSTCECFSINLSKQGGRVVCEVLLEASLRT